MTDLALPDAARMQEIFDSVKNWGRWGDDDEAGALNLITDEVRRGAAAAVRHGRAVSCARDIPVVTAARPSATASARSSSARASVEGDDESAAEAMKIRGGQGDFACRDRAPSFFTAPATAPL